MAITYPPIFTEIKDEEVSFNRPVTEETMRKIAQNMNMFSKLAPVGTIRAIDINRPGISLPDSNIWQLCDGGEITNPTSPLRTSGIIHRFTPNMLGRFIMGAPNTLSNGFGGSASIDLTHNHGGSTGGNGPNSTVGEEGDEKPTRQDHLHSIGNALSPVALDPKHLKMAFYLKIN